MSTLRPCRHDYLKDAELAILSFVHGDLPLGVLGAVDELVQICKILSLDSACHQARTAAADPERMACIIALAQAEGILPSLHEAVAARYSSVATKTDRGVLATHHEANRRRNVELRSALLELGAAGEAAGFRFVTLKGAAWLLEDATSFAAWRQMFDLDVLVESDKFGAIPGFLEGLGYAPASTDERFTDNFHHAPYWHPRVPVALEVHRHAGWRDELLPPEMLFNGAQNAAPGLWIAKPWIRAFHAIVHWQIQDHGSTRRTLPLKELIEIARFLRRRDVDWALLAAHATGVGSLAACENAIASAHVLLGAPVPSQIVPGAAGQRWVSRAIARRKSPLGTWLATQRFRAGTLWWCDKVRYRSKLAGHSRETTALLVAGARLVRLPLIVVRTSSIMTRALAWAARDASRGSVLGGNISRWIESLVPARPTLRHGTVRSEHPLALPSKTAWTPQSEHTRAISYTYRPNLFLRERTYRIGGEALYWSSAGGAETKLAYTEIAELRIKQRATNRRDGIRRTIAPRLSIRSRSRRRLAFSPLHAVRFRKWQDRTTEYSGFVDALIKHARTANPHLIVRQESRPTLRRAGKRIAMSALAMLCRSLMAMLRNRDPERVARYGGRLMVEIGPWLRSDRVARSNLKAAFPEKTQSEIDNLVQGVWDNFGRILAEYMFLDRFMDPRDPAGMRLIFDPASARRLADLRNSGRPVLAFFAHVGNWEFASHACKIFGIDGADVYQTTGYATTDDLIAKIRSRDTKWIAAGPGAAALIRTALRQGVSVAMAADRHFPGGQDVIFFGRSCTINPTLVRFARALNCPIHGIRIVRMVDGRYRVEFTEAIQPRCDATGKIDVAATVQAIIKIVEGWIREQPEQWLWMHRQWR